MHATDHIVAIGVLAAIGCRARWRAAGRGHPGLRAQVPVLLLDLPRAGPAPQALRRGVRRRAASGWRTRARSRRAPPTTSATRRCELMRELPLAVPARGLRRAGEKDTPPRSTSQWPWVFKILSGGPDHPEDLVLLLLHPREGRRRRPRGRLGPVQLGASGSPSTSPSASSRSATRCSSVSCGSSGSTTRSSRRTSAMPASTSPTIAA